MNSIVESQSDISEKSERNHYISLESLRGLAALMVAVFHSYVALKFSGIDQLWQVPIWYIQPLDTLDAFTGKLILTVVNGQAAVSIFFVLSGIVLGLSLDHDPSGIIRRYIRFLTKRLFRIYPAHIFSLLLICAAIFLFSAVNPGSFAYASSAYNAHYRVQPDGYGIIRNLLLFDTFLNTVTWTIKVEMVIAFVFPILHFFSRLRNSAAIWINSGILAMLVVLSIIYNDGLFTTHIYKFYLGLLLPLYLPKVGYLKHWALWPVSFILLLLLPQVPISNDLKRVLMSVGAVLLISLLMKQPDSWLSQNKMIKKLGQYSYSFYLFHFPIMWFSYFLLFHNKLFVSFVLDSPFAVASMMCVLSILMTYAISSASYWLIEKRFILVGRKLAGFI